MLTPRRFACALAILVAACSDNTNSNENNSHLPEGGIGNCGTMSCNAPQVCCSGTCVDTTRDLAHCGGCGTQCPSGRSDTCSNAQCTCGSAAVCDASKSCCGAAGCKDLQTDTANCGTCGHACMAGEICSGGNCMTYLCNGMPCQNLCCSNQCVDTSTDPNNCGGCNIRCNTAIGQTCQRVGGGLPQCVTLCGGVMCMMGQGCCGNTCANLQLDMNNCGACGRACNPQTEFCLLGCCANVNTFSCGDGGFPFPDGGFPFPDSGVPFPDAMVSMPDGGNGG